jgi:hypothetical protein
VAANQPEQQDDWLKELDAAYAGCETMSDLFEVDRKLFHPVAATASPDERASADEIRQEHLTRIEQST